MFLSIILPSAYKCLIYRQNMRRNYWNSKHKSRKSKSNAKRSRDRAVRLIMELIICKKRTYSFNVRNDMINTCTPHMSRLKEISNTRNARLEIIRKRYNHSYQAIQWLRENKGIFKEEVFEPVLMEV